MEIFSGIFSFLVTSLDDYFFLVLFYFYRKNEFHKTIFGTFLALFLIVIASYVLKNSIMELFDLKKYSPYIISIVLVYIIYQLYNSLDDSVDKDEINNKSSQSMVKVSFLTYLFNGSDDFITYVGFITAYDDKKVVLYFTGVFLGLALLVLLVKLSFRLIQNNQAKYEKNIKKVFIVLAFGVICYYLWWFFKKSPFFFFTNKNIYYN